LFPAGGRITAGLPFLGALSGPASPTCPATSRRNGAKTRHGCVTRCESLPC